MGARQEETPDVCRESRHRSALEGCDAAFELSAKCSKFCLYGFHANFEVPQSTLYPAESRTHLGAQLRSFVAQSRDFVAVRSNLDGDDVEELQDLRSFFVFHGTSGR